MLNFAIPDHALLQHYIISAYSVELGKPFQNIYTSIQVSLIVCDLSSITYVFLNKVRGKCLFCNGLGPLKTQLLSNYKDNTKNILGTRS